MVCVTLTRLHAVPPDCVCNGIICLGDVTQLEGNNYTVAFMDLDWDRSYTLTVITEVNDTAGGKKASPPRNTTARTDEGGQYIHPILPSTISASLLIPPSSLLRSLHLQSAPFTPSTPHISPSSNLLPVHSCSDGVFTVLSSSLRLCLQFLVLCQT